MGEGEGERRSRGGRTRAPPAAPCPRTEPREALAQARRAVALAAVGALDVLHLGVDGHKLVALRAGELGARNERRDVARGQLNEDLEEAEVAVDGHDVALRELDDDAGRVGQRVEAVDDADRASAG